MSSPSDSMHQVSYKDYLEFRDRNKSFDGMGRLPSNCSGLAKMRMRCRNAGWACWFRETSFARWEWSRASDWDFETTKTGCRVATGWWC